MIYQIIILVASLIAIGIAIALLMQHKRDKEFCTRATKKDIDELRHKVWCLENPPQLAIGQNINIIVPYYKDDGTRRILNIFKGKITAHSVKEYRYCGEGRGHFSRTYEYFDGSKISSFDESYCKHIKKPKCKKV